MADQNQTPPPSDENITRVSVESEMKQSYLDYAMSVIVSRALPDVRDGLKPVHRRIFYAMHEGGYHWNRPYRKSARIVGDVMGNYHPHGGEAIYEAMVRMAQPFSMRLPLVDGQGNFGSMDGDPPAAMRYTEARLNKAAHELLEDIDKDTVDFRSNYDESRQEPIVIPAKFPNILVNGGGGIAVGMATNIPPHNLGEVIDACCALVDAPQLSDAELFSFIKGPDFPTGGIILGQRGIREAFLTGRSPVVVRGRTHIETREKERQSIIITEVPYQVNKARMLEKIAELVKNKVIEGISDIRDESDKDGVRAVIDLKRDANSDVILNQLYKYSPLQTSFGINMLALNKGQPQQLNLRQILQAFLEFREEVIVRRTTYELNKARGKAHILVGLAIAVVNLDPIIQLIKAAPNPQEALRQLLSKNWPVKDIGPLILAMEDTEYVVNDDETYTLSETQAKAILDLKLHRLTGLERDKISDELNNVVEQIKKYLEILASRELVLDILKTELIEIKEKYDNPRRTSIEEGEFETDIEDLIPKEEMVVTFTKNGYTKRVPLNTYRAQRRGGKGRAGMSTRDDDFVNQVFVLNTHTPVLFFSSKGIVYKIKVYKLPLGSPQSLGKPLINILPLDKGEIITTIMPLSEDESTYDDHTIFFATKQGNIRRNKLSDFTRVMANGKIAMKLQDDDALVGVSVCSDDNDALLATKNGKCIRFPITAVRIFTGRASTGVRGIRLNNDHVISLSILKSHDVETDERMAYIKAANAKRRSDDDDVSVDDLETSLPISDDRFTTLSEKDEFLLSVTTNGYGKQTSTYEYRTTNRGGSGIVNIDTSERNGQVVGSFIIHENDQLMLITDHGKIIRIPVNDIRVTGRTTQGVRLFNVSDNEKVVSVTTVKDIEDDDTDEEETDVSEENSETNSENNLDNVE